MHSSGIEPRSGDRFGHSGSSVIAPEVAASTQGSDFLINAALVISGG
jgi:hypothetical protein